MDLLGLDADPTVYDLNGDFKRMSSSSFCSRSMGGNPVHYGMMPMVFDDDLIAILTNVDNTWDLAMERGNP